jgi:hypothetical protein
VNFPTFIRKEDMDTLLKEWELAGCYVEKKKILCEDAPHYFEEWWVSSIKIHDDEEWERYYVPRSDGHWVHVHVDVASKASAAVTIAEMLKIPE